MQGKIINERYKIIEEIGKGGMAIVYSAHDTLLDRKVAIKMLRPEHYSDNDFKEKFRQEARAVARLSHPNVVSIYDIGIDDDYIFLVMEIIKGKNLKDLIKERGHLSLVEALEIGKQIASALDAAHKNNIIHCDIKPHNIILTDDMEVKVTDFGIARAVNSATMKVTDTIVGSAHYFSPEQAKGGDIKAYSDLYSLGIVLYEMTTGELPFHGESPISVALKHLQQEAVRPAQINKDIPVDVDNLIMKAMEKNPSDRFQSASQMREAITLALKNLKNSQNHINIINKKSDPGETKILKKTDIFFRKNNDKKYNESNDDSGIKKVDKNNVKKSLFKNKEGKNEKFFLKRTSVWILVIILFFSAAVFGGYFFFNSYTNVPVVEVPDIVGLSFEEAEKELGQVGLKFEENKEKVFSEEVPENHIISQFPAPGERVRQTRKINITISKGPELIKLPDLSGMELREALVELENLSLNKYEIEYVFRLSIKAGRVIEQIPAAGAEIKSDELITLFVSRGERDMSVSMPDLTGMDRTKAFQRLRELGLNVGKIKLENSTRFSDGQIISQSYNPGDMLPEGTPVDLVISRGLLNPENAEIYSSSIKVNVNNIKATEVKIVVKDNSGKDVVYNAVHQPGESIMRNITSVGPTEIKIYFDNRLIRTKKIGG
ncbi:MULTISPECIES: Stk1 family PASTA domain-containing Ser/Thr kinase [unclassified Halanaerobium]|uniref:Stk1 family PASTA domain-containing Ser/Thr kinase n=1 Tax=unclassified Halanaerobium TaxID=2641197 RepID=UPI000DF12D5F|nr:MULTISPECIES: Stk1 family PASTA domain-containing Ser/Thr kinase [unclassified Halanaerobium]RCW51418.1 serine/threonine-protein kinase [Halanaerobium sp. MA284_MarDTE_T2]RCW89207.1 serine/threonine-protein kinase [Halanaerobium sp. DL-01]